jgi:hypothetical protein
LIVEEFHTLLKFRINDSSRTNYWSLKVTVKFQNIFLEQQRSSHTLNVRSRTHSVSDENLKF